MGKTLTVISTLFLGAQISAFAATVPPGTEIQVRPDATIDVSHWDRGRIYPAHVARDVFARDGDLAIRRGSEAELIVRQVGPGQFALDLESITSEGHRYVMDTTGPEYQTHRQDYDQDRGVLGAIAGAIAGASGERVESRGEEIHIPQGTMVTFRLQQPLHMAEWGDPGYMQGQDHYHRDHDWYR